MKGKRTEHCKKAVQCHTESGQLNIFLWVVLTRNCTSGFRLCLYISLSMALNANPAIEAIEAGSIRRILSFVRSKIRNIEQWHVICFLIL